MGRGSKGNSHGQGALEEVGSWEGEGTGEVLVLSYLLHSSIPFREEG